MALMANGIVGGDMAWPLVIVGMFLALGLILIKAPSPMLIAVGMYLPFESTSAIFVGGLFALLLQWIVKKQEASEDEKMRAENTGTLLSSGFIAGESLMAVALAFLVLGADRFPALASLQESMSGFSANYWPGLLIYPAMIYLLVILPLQKMKESGLPSTKIE